MALFVVLSSAVLLLTPPWEANDEPGHVRNVVTLSNGEWYRIRADPELFANEAHQPPLYYLGLAGVHQVLGLDDRIPDHMEWEGGFLVTEKRNWVHPTSREAADTELVRWLRVPGIILGAGVVVLTYLTARLLARDRWTPVLAAATVAFLPRFVFVSGVVNNDNLAVFLGALLIYACTRLVVRPLRHRRELGLAALGLGALVGTMVLTKLSMLPIAVVAVVAIVLAGRGRRQVPAMLGLFVVAIAAVCGWWLLRNQDWYGDPFAADASNEYLKTVFIAVGSAQPDRAEIVTSTAPSALLDSFFYTSGWNQFAWPTSWNVVLWGVTIVPLAGVALLWRKGDVRTRQATALLGVVFVAAVASLWITGLSNSTLPKTIQGRLVLPGLAALGCLTALGWERLRAPVAARLALPLLFLAGTLYALWDDVWLVYH